jgi:HlyD family secretion protein
MKLFFEQLRYRQLKWALASVLAVIIAIPAFSLIATNADAKIDSAINRPGKLPITAPGRVQPKDGVLNIAAPASAETGPAIVTELKVHRGDWVQANQELATLRGRTELQSSLASAQRRVALGQARLTALKAGGKQEDIAASHSQVQSDEATFSLIQTQTKRARQLRSDGLLSAADLEIQESRLEIATQTLGASRARLRGLSSVRPADVAVVQAELNAAESEVAEVLARLESTVVRAPAAGRILEIYCQPGQMIGAQGLLAFGKTSEMFVDAEVLEEDLGRARTGQKVRITGDALPQPVTGTVEEIGYLVGSRQVFNTDPTAFADSRVVNVSIRADDPALLERYINARVTVVIEQ